MLVVGVVWLGVLFLPWLLLLFITMLSVTAEDEPLLWIALGLFLPAVVLGAVSLAIGYAKNKKLLMLVSPVLPTAAVGLAWIQAYAVG